MAKRPDDIVLKQDDRRIPSLAVSEQIIRDKAPAALMTLGQHNAMDLAEMLGLASYAEGN